jgi:hypothetical protein
MDRSALLVGGLRGVGSVGGRAADQSMVQNGCLLPGVGTLERRLEASDETVLPEHAMRGLPPEKDIQDLDPSTLVGERMRLSLRG